MAKCFKKGCEAATEEGSNYCAAHLPGQVTAKKVLKSDSASKGSRADKKGGADAPGPRPPPK